jgi:NAD(P)-dependent dehydrogenase (short-subunit alcohol dehydrogenase family)
MKEQAQPMTSSSFPQSPPPVRALLDLSGRVALVTGAGSGIGRTIAHRFAEAGAAVMVHYQTSRDGAETLVTTIASDGGRAAACAADLTDPVSANQLVEATAEIFGRLDILVNNAGTYPLASITQMQVEDWDLVVDTNLKSVFLCTQAAARHMVAAGTGGAIVNVSSIEAENPAPSHSHYNAAKGGVLMYTRAAAGELGRHGIRVNAVAPGLIWKEGIETSWPDGVARYLAAVPLQRLGQPDDVADACLFLASPASRWITGASLTVDGGVLTHQIY